MHAPAPDKRLRRARAAVTFVFFANGALLGSWVARIPAVKSDLGLSDGVLGFALFGVAAGVVVAMPIAEIGKPCESQGFPLAGL